MPNYIVSHFSAGIVDREWGGRVDIDRYTNGCWDIVNGHVLPSGAITRRLGTRYLANTKGNNKPKLIPWKIDATSGNVVEITDGYMRFYKHGGQILDTGSPVEIATPIDEADGLNNIRYVQTYDGIRFVNGAIEPQFLDRTDETTWAIQGISSNAGYSYTSPPTNFPDLTSVFPGLIAYHGERIWYARTSSRTDQAYVSAANGDYDEFDESDPIVSTDAFTQNYNSRGNTVIQWFGTQDALMYADQNSVFLIADRNTLIDPSLDAFAVQIPIPQSEVGAAFVDPIRIEDSLVFVDSSGKRLRRVYFLDNQQKYMADDITISSGEIFTGDIVELHYQKVPQQYIWAITDDGSLLSMTYNSSMQIASWTRHDLSGDVESMAIIPGDGTEYVFLAVKRTINGSTVRFVEEIEQPDYIDDRTDAWFVDAGIKQEGGDIVTGTAVTVYDRSGVGGYPNIQTISISATSHGLSTNDLVKLQELPSAFRSLDGNVYEVVEGDDPRVGGSADPDTFWIGHPSGDLVNITSLGLTNGDVYSGSPEAVPGDPDITGLSHLEGETVAIFGDGSVIASEVVSSGQVTANEFCNKYIVGLPTTITIEPTDVRTSQNMFKRILNLFVKVWKTTFVKVGPNSDNLAPVNLRQGAFSMDVAPDLYTGNAYEATKSGWSYEGSMVIHSDQPTPLTLLSVIAELEIER